MSKFYRCGNPQETCDLSKTKDVVAKTAWEEHCIASPTCEIYGEEVPFYSVIPAKIKIAIASGIAVLAIILLSMALRPDPLVKEVQSVRSDVQQLDSKLNTLESVPKEDLAADGAAQALRKIPDLIASSKSRLDAIIIARDTAQFEVEKQKAQKLQQQCKELTKSATSQTTGQSNSVKGEATQLITAFQDVEIRIESLTDRITTAGSIKLLPDCEEIKNQISDGISRASRLLKSQSPNNGDLPEILGKVDSGLKDLDRLMASFVAITPPPFADSEATLTISASGKLADNLVLPLLAARAQGNQIESSGTIYFSSTTGDSKNRVVIHRSDNSGHNNLINKKCDLVITDLEPTESERSQFSSSFSGAVMDSHANAQVIALDALTFSVHPGSKLELLTPSSLTKGRKLIGSLKGSPGELAASRFGVQLTDSTDQRPADAVLMDESAVGVGLFHEEGSNIRAKRLAFQASPSAAALKPSPFTIAPEDYKFSFRIVAWNSPASSRDAIEFVKFITSSQGQKVVSDQGFVDLRLRVIPGEVDPIILAALAQATGLKKITGAKRLSTNFRFATGEDTFDLKAQGDLERVPLQIAQDYPSERTVILGFTDNTGAPNVNMPLSQRRAETVATILRKSGIDVKTAGLGDQFPVDTNETVDGKARNRRSEVWLVTP
jgi:outer membrane protein OmpA-like peptidoglycan-associated protein